MMSRVAERFACWFGGVVAAIGLAGAAMSGLSQEPPAPPRLLRPDHPDAEATKPSDADATFHLNNDATLRRWLKEGRARLDAGQISEGLTLWQRILDRGDDGFVRLRSDGAWLEVRHEVQRGLSALSPADQAAYERLFGTPARQLFEQSRKTGRSIFAAECLRRYFHTAAGFEAAHWLATRWLDQGQPRVAARLFERLVSEPIHRHRVSNHLLMQAAMACRLAGHESRARELFARLGDTKLWIGGVERPAAQLAAGSEVLPRPRGDGIREWLTVGGSFGRNAIPNGSTPWLKPLWPPVPLTSLPSERSALREWLASREEHHGHQLAVAAEPIVVQGQVVVRELSSIASFDLRSGRRQWVYPSALPWSEWLPRAMAQAGETNRIGAVRETVVTNSACGTFSTDRRCVFAVDLLPPEGKDVRLPSADDDSPKRELDSLTQLIALPLEAAPSETDHSSAPRVWKPRWTLDGLAAANKLGHRGCAVQFLGPPAIVDDYLFVMGELFSFDEMIAEKNHQLCLVAIDALTGEPLWTQGLALVDEPFFRPRQRPRRNPVGSPTVADGIVICPTDVGLIVGVDLVTGRQRWVHSYRVGEAGPRRDSYPESFGWDGMPTWPVIHRDRVLLLPRFSEELHCLEVATGRLVWRIPRGQAMSIGAVMDDRIVLVSDREVRAIPMPPDGTPPDQSLEPLWTQSLGPVTGRGVRVGDDFLVPLKSGRVACLELATGRDRGFAVTRTSDLAALRRKRLFADEVEVPDEEFAPWPGNLIACDDVVVSLGLNRLAVYPQARAALEAVRTRPPSVERQLQESELTMLLGVEGSPVAQLQDVLRQPLSLELRQQAERQLRESLYLELNRHPEQADELLPQLERLAETTTERARLLRRICEISLASDPARTVQAARDLAALSLDHELELDEHGQHVVSLDTWARGYLRQVRERVADSPEEAERVNQLLNHERDGLVASRDLHALRQFVQLCDDWPHASDVRFRLADLLIDRGDFQEAELLLARDRLSDDPRVAAAATARMLRLWERVGLYTLCANLLSELEERFGVVQFPVAPPTAGTTDKTPGPTLVTGREFVAAFPRDSMVWEAYLRRRRPDWDVRRVVISEDRLKAGELRLVEAFGNGDIRNRALVRGGVGVHLFQTQPILRPLSDAGWHLVDRDSGVVTGQLPELDRYYPTGVQSGPPTAVNHFFPVGGPGRMLGFSLLGGGQSEANWETAFAPLRATQEFLRVGPVGPGFCVFQSRQQLVVVDPTTGRVSWRRELEPHAGLLAESDSGLFGDRESLVVFGSDQASYTVYETATGRELRRGRLSVDQHQSRRAFGRKLVHVTNANNDRRLRIWDPLTDRNELDEPLAGGVSSVVTVDGELLVLQRTGRVRIIDVHNSLVKLDVMLSENDVRGVNTLRAFSDRDRYYLNLQRMLENTGRSPFSYFLTDSLIPKAEVLGELYAFARPREPQPLDRAVAGPLGKKLWMRVLPQRTILRLDNASLPFLVAISRQSDRTRSDKSALLVEALDASTGDLLGALDHVLTTRFVLTQHDPEAARLTVVGLQTRLTLEYGRDKQRFATLHDPH